MSQDTAGILSAGGRSQATAESRLLASRIAQAAVEIEQDPRHHERLDAIECPACFYFLGGDFDGQATHECVACAHSFTALGSGSVLLCEICAEARQQCRRCGADLAAAGTDLPVARMFGAFRDLHLRSLPAIARLIQWAYVASPQAARELANSILADLEEFGLGAQARILRDRLGKAAEFAAGREPVLPIAVGERESEPDTLFPDDALAYILKSLRRYGFVLKDLGREASRESAQDRLRAWAHAQAGQAGQPELWERLAGIFGRALASDQLIRAMVRQRQEQTLDLE